MSEKYLPIKIFEKRKDYDDRSTEGGGDSHEGSWVLHGEELNKRVDYLSKNVNTIQDSFQKWKENKRALPMIISTTVIDKAIAKTHRGRIVNLLENVEGLNMALQLMQNIGKKRYAVAMSKVVASEEGVKKTRSLFEGLNVAQEDLIPVYYKQEIALSNRYPIDSVDILVSYKELSDYILNNEKIERNKKLLMNGMKEQMLGQMFIEKQRLVRFLAVEQFLNQEANMFLKYRYREELFGIRNTQIKRRYKKGGMRMFQQLYIQL